MFYLDPWWENHEVLWNNTIFHNVFMIQSFVDIIYYYLLELLCTNCYFLTNWRCFKATALDHISVLLVPIIRLEMGTSQLAKSCWIVISNVSFGLLFVRVCSWGMAKNGWLSTTGLDEGRGGFILWDPLFSKGWFALCLATSFICSCFLIHAIFYFDGADTSFAQTLMPCLSMQHKWGLTWLY